MPALAGAASPAKQVVGHSLDGSTSFVLTRAALTPDDTDVCLESPYGPRCEDIFAVSPAGTRLMTPVTGNEAPVRFAGASSNGSALLYYTGTDCLQPAGCARLHRFDGVTHEAIAGDDAVLRSLSPSADRVVFSTRSTLTPDDQDGAGACPFYGPGQPVSYGCVDLYEWSASGYRLLPAQDKSEQRQRAKAKKKAARKRAKHHKR